MAADRHDEWSLICLGWWLGAQLACALLVPIIAIAVLVAGLVPVALGLGFLAVGVAMCAHSVGVLLRVRRVALGGTDGR